MIDKGDDSTVVITSKSNRSSISLFHTVDSNGELLEMEGSDRPNLRSFRCLLKQEFNNAGQMAYGVKSESIYVAHKRGLMKINQDGNVFKIDTNSAYGLAVDKNEDVYFASYDGLEILRAGGERFSIIETVCGGKWNYDNRLDGVRQMFYDSQSDLLYFTEEKAVRTVKLKAPLVHLDARLREDLGRLIDSDDIPASDQVTFLVEGKRIRVSKTILCLRSEYFKAMFLSGFAESQANASPISLSDTTYDTFYALVAFIVTGRFEIKECSKYLLDVLILSDRYLVQDLKSLCSKMLVDFAGDNLETVLNYACLAEKRGFQELLNACLDSIVPELEDACCQEAFKNLSKSTLLEIISRSTKI